MLAEVDELSRGVVLSSRVDITESDVLGMFEPVIERRMPLSELQ